MKSEDQHNKGLNKRPFCLFFSFSLDRLLSRLLFAFRSSFLLYFFILVLSSSFFILPTHNKKTATRREKAKKKRKEGMTNKLLVCLSVLLCVSFASVSANDCPYYDTLSEFYTATGGPNWIDNTGWLGDGCPCSEKGVGSWYGIGCVSGAITYM